MLAAGHLTVRGLEDGRHALEVGREDEVAPGGGEVVGLQRALAVVDGRPVHLCEVCKRHRRGQRVHRYAVFERRGPAVDVSGRLAQLIVRTPSRRALRLVRGIRGRGRGRGRVAVIIGCHSNRLSTRRLGHAHACG